MHILVLILKIAVRAAIALFIPGGMVLVAADLYRIYRKRKAKNIEPSPTPATETAK